MQEHHALKTQAKRLRESLAKTFDVKATIAQSLEVVSHINGYADWNTAKALEDQSQPATLDATATETLFPNDSPHAIKARARHQAFLLEFKRLCGLSNRDKERDDFYKLTVEYIPCGRDIPLSMMKKSVQQLWRENGTLFRRLVGLQNVYVQQLHRCNENDINTPYWVLLVVVGDQNEPLLFPSLYKEKDQADEMAMKLLVAW